MASSTQKRILLGLESGRKIVDLMREPGMPSKAMLDEWLDNPEYRAEYDAAVTKGRPVREAQQAGRAIADDVVRRPAVLREVPADAYLRPERAQRAITSPVDEPVEASLPQHKMYDVQVHADGTATTGGVDTEPTTFGSMPTVPIPAEPGEASLPQKKSAGTRPSMTIRAAQEYVLKQLASGVPQADLFRDVRGFNGTKLASWRKDADFKKRHEAAKLAGQQFRIVAIALSAKPLVDTVPLPNGDVASGDAALAAKNGVSDSPAPAPEEARNFAVCMLPAQGDDMLTLGEAQAEALKLAQKSGRSVMVVARICTATMVPQITF